MGLTDTSTEKCINKKYYNMGIPNTITALTSTFTEQSIKAWFPTIWFIENVTAIEQLLNNCWIAVKGFTDQFVVNCLDAKHFYNITIFSLSWILQNLFTC